MENENKSWFKKICEVEPSDKTFKLASLLTLISGIISLYICIRQFLVPIINFLVLGGDMNIGNAIGNSFKSLLSTVFPFILAAMLVVVFILKKKIPFVFSAVPLVFAIFVCSGTELVEISGFYTVTTTIVKIFAIILFICFVAAYILSLLNVIKNDKLCGILTAATGIATILMGVFAELLTLLGQVVRFFGFSSLFDLIEYVFEYITRGRIERLIENCMDQIPYSLKYSFNFLFGRYDLLALAASALIAIALIICVLDIKGVKLGKKKDKAEKAVITKAE